MIKIEFNKEGLIKSPLNYTGSKYRLLKKGMLEYFPNKVDTFYDLFRGAGNISINVKANNIIYNDYINFLPEMFNYWKTTDMEYIISYINKTIYDFKLSSTNKDGFLNFREYYNNNKKIQDLFILICYSFNYQMRFNNNKQYNSSFGKEASTMNNNILKNLNLFINKIKNSNIVFLNKDFRQVINVNSLNDNDFVYLDPPYSISCGVYQDGKRGFKGWTVQDDLDLLKLCDELNDNGIKFAMSNMLESKGIVNNTMKNWSTKYNVINLDMNYNGSNYHRTINNKDSEVLITNY